MLFRNSSYRLYFVGLSITSAGTWMQSVVQAWLVYRISGSAFWLGMLPVCISIPAFLVSPVAGVLADRVNRRKILLSVQVLLFFQAVALAALVYSGNVQVWQVLVLSVVLGMCSGIDITTRHAFAVDLVGKEDLPAAISLNGVLMSGARITGPALAGVLIGILGEAGCFALNALSCLPQIICLVLLRPRTIKSIAPIAVNGFLGHLTEGVRYVRKKPIILEMIALCGLLCFIASPFTTLLPVFAKIVLGGNVKTLSWLSSTMGLGAICGSFFFNKTRDSGEAGRHLAIRMICWGLSLLALGLSRSLGLSLLAMFAIGYCMMSIFPIMNNVIQDQVDDAMRGRVLSLYTMPFLGLVPIGSIVMGWSADRFNAPAVVLVSGVFTAFSGLLLAMWRRPR